MVMQNMIGIIVTLRMLNPVQGFEHTVWILWQRRHPKVHQTHICPTLHVEPNYAYAAIAHRPQAWEPAGFNKIG